MTRWQKSCEIAFNTRLSFQIASKQLTRSIQMGQEFVSGTKTVNEGQDARVWWLIMDLSRAIALLDCDILAEEERALVFDPKDITYPLLAQTLRARRDNLKATIVALELKTGVSAVSSVA
jgi:hypothetical protein